jgi:urea transporter
MTLMKSLLRGMGQITYCNNVGSGLLVTTAIGLANPVLAGLALLGCGSSTAMAIALAQDESRLYRGLYGFNGDLLG